MIGLLIVLILMLACTIWACLIIASQFPPMDGGDK